MASYEYSARTSGGQPVTGVIQAENEAAVKRALDERKLFPIQVRQQQTTVGARLGRGRVKMRDVGVLYGQLADLLRSGVPLLRALDVLIKAANARLADMIRSVREDVAAGKSLAEAIANHPKTFTPLHAAMVRAGEAGGFLEDVLTNLSAFIERQDELRGKIRGALIYPAVLMGLGLLIMLGLMLFVIPQFKTFFQGVTLPTATQVVFAVSDLLVNRLHLLLAVVVLAVLAVRAYVRSDSGRRAWDRWRLKLPGLGKALRLLAVTRFCRILGTMLASGVPILRALEISKDATGSGVMAAAVEQAAEAVRRGEPLAGPLRASGLFPTEVVEMVAVAEESNQLEKVLVQIADTVERRTNRQLDQAVRLVEPLVLVVMAIGIAFVGGGLLYPIFTMSQSLR
jgi:general secretion pathway protein F/type IV pilus assembly protein PilC